MFARVSKDPRRLLQPGQKCWRSLVLPDYRQKWCGSAKECELCLTVTPWGLFASLLQAEKRKEGSEKLAGEKRERSEEAGCRGPGDRGDRGRLAVLARSIYVSVHIFVFSCWPGHSSQTFLCDEGESHQH